MEWPVETTRQRARLTDLHNSACLGPALQQTSKPGVLNPPQQQQQQQIEKAVASGAVSGRATVPSSGTGHVICGAPALDYPRPKCELASFVV